MILKHVIHNVPELPNPIRLQEYGVGIFSEALTKSALKKALKKKYLFVDGAIAYSSTWIKGGEIIEFKMHEEVSKVFEWPLEILFEDEYLAIINKPAGILVSGNAFRTIANALPHNLSFSKMSDATLPQPVHRLDFATTGALLIGKTHDSIRILNKMFEFKEISKSYLAITIGKMIQLGSISDDIDMKASRTDFEVKKSISSLKYDSLNLVQLHPQTGRRHQIRKHLAGIGNPILGDKDYGLKGLILKGKGLFLHAYSLAFIHPFLNEEISVQAKLPLKFKKIFPETNID